MYVVHSHAKRLQVLRTWKQTKGFKRKATKKLLQEAEQPLRDAASYLEQMRRWPAKHHYGRPLEQAIRTLAAARRRHQPVRALETAAVEALFNATKGHWSGKSIELAAKAVGWQSAYQTFYRYASPFTHAGDIEQHVTYGKSGGLALKLIPAADEDVARTMETASFMLWVLADRLNERFGLRQGARINATKPAMLRRRIARSLR